MRYENETPLPLPLEFEKTVQALKDANTNGVNFNTMLDEQVRNHPIFKISGGYDSRRHITMQRMEVAHYVLSHESLLKFESDDHKLTSKIFPSEEKQLMALVVYTSLAGIEFPSTIEGLQELLTEVRLPPLVDSNPHAHDLNYLAKDISSKSLENFAHKINNLIKQEEQGVAFPAEPAHNPSSNAVQVQTLQNGQLMRNGEVEGFWR